MQNDLHERRIDMMQDRLSNDVITAIEKNLPEQTAGVLKKRLEDVELLELRHKDCVKENDRVSKENDLFRKRIKKEDELDQRELKLAERETAVAQREFEIKLKDMEIRFLNERVCEIKEMFRVPFMNRQLRESCFGVAPGGMDNSGYPQTVSVNKDKTVTEES